MLAGALTNGAGTASSRSFVRRTALYGEEPDEPSPRLLAYFLERTQWIAGSHGRISVFEGVISSGWLPSIAERCQTIAGGRSVAETTGRRRRRSHTVKGCQKMIFRPRFLPSLRDGNLSFALFRWCRCAQPPLRSGNPWVQPAQVVGAQKLRCARSRRPEARCGFTSTAKFDMYWAHGRSGRRLCRPKLYEI